MDLDQLKLFKETYGPSAFICRYAHCSRANSGFQSARKREEHESTHQRKYRCAYPSCTFFAIGFSTKGKLGQHNEKYHAVHVKNINLLDAVSLTLRQIRRTPATNNLRQVEVQPRTLKSKRIPGSSYTNMM